MVPSHPPDNVWGERVVFTAAVTLKHTAPLSGRGSDMPEEPAPKVKPERQGSFDDMMLRLGIKNKMKQSVDEGATFREACDKAGVPYELALAATKTDDDFQEIWRTARKEVDDPQLPCPSTVWQSATEVKDNFLNMLTEAGLWHKLAQMAAMAEPGTEEGNKVLMFFGRAIMPTMLPKETKREETVVELHQKSDNELLEMLKEMRAHRIESSNAE